MSKLMDLYRNLVSDPTAVSGYRTPDGQDATDDVMLPIIKEAEKQDETKPEDDA